MRPVATDGVAWSVCCLCVCLLIAFVSPTKTVKPIEMPFAWVTRVGPRNHVLDGGGVQIPQGNGNFGVVWPIKKHWKSLLQNTHQKSITASARLLQVTALLPTGRCYINFFTVKKPPLRCGLSSKLFDNLLTYMKPISHVKG